MSIFQLAELSAEPLTREELGENRVAYRNMAILKSGVWRDSGSGQAIWYSPEGLRNMELTEDNAVNIMHDVDNEVSETGEMKNLREENGTLYVDVVLDTSSAAGQYADENMRTTLESEGQKGFGGPSVEIPEEGQHVEMNPSKGLKELKEGLINGLGLVKNPASKPVSFARQATTRDVALSDGDNTMAVYLQEDGMNVKAVKNALENNGVDAAELSDEQLSAIADSLLEDDEEEEEEKEDKENEEEEEEEAPPEGDGEESEEEAEESDEEEGEEMAGEELQVIQEQIDELWNAMEEMKEAMMSESELSEELESAKEELADAETVSELSEAKDELDKRLSELEDEPEKPRTMSDGEEWNPEYDSSIGSPSNW